MPRGIAKKRNASDEPIRENKARERRANRPLIIDPNQFYSVDEASAARDQSRATTLKAIATQKLLSVKDGRRRKIIGSEIIRVNQLDAERLQPAKPSAA